MRATTWIRAGLVALPLIAACALDTGPAVELRMAAICCYNEGDPQISLPDTALVGVPTIIAVTIYGGGCHRGGPTQLTTSPAAVHVTPFDSLYLRPVCTLVLASFDHRVEVTFPMAGSMTVRVHGLSSDTAALYERDIVVK
jgi:hypothetical protein